MDPLYKEKIIKFNTHYSIFLKNKYEDEYYKALFSCFDASVKYYSSSSVFDKECCKFFGISIGSLIKWFSRLSGFPHPSMRLKVLNWCKKHLETLV